MPTVNELLDKAKAELSNLLSGEVFLLRDLFKEYEEQKEQKESLYVVI